MTENKLETGSNPIPAPPELELATYPEFEAIRHIFRAVAVKDERGSFLKHFARAVISADDENLALLFDAAIELIDKYKLP